MWGIIAASRVRSKPNIGFLQVKEIPNVLLGSGVNYTFSFDNQPNPNSKVLIFIATQNAGVAAEIPNAQLLITLSANQGGRIYQPNTPLQTYTMTTLLNGRFWIYMLEIENCDIITPVGFTLNPITNNITSLSSNVLKNDVLITIHNSCPTTLPSLVASNQYTNISPSINNPVEGFSRLYDNEFLDETTTLSYTESAVNIRLFTVRLLRNYTQFLPETQDIINRAILEGFTLPSQFTINCIDRLIREMKLSGYWQKRDLILNFAYNDDSLENFSRINWKNPTGNLSDYIRTGRLNYLGDTNSLTTNWSLVSSTRITGQSDPLGGNEAILVTTTGASNRYQQVLNNNLVSGKVYNFSVYAKFSVGTAFRLQMGSSTSESTIFNLQDGTVTSTAGGFFNAQIEDVGGGWYRCSASFTHIQGLNPAFAISGTGSAYFIWGGQLTFGSTLQTYQPNTSSQGLLVYSTEGVVGSVNNTDEFINTNWNPTVNFVNYQLDNANRDVVIQKIGSLQTANSVISGVDSSAAERWGNFNGIISSQRINQGTTNTPNINTDMSGNGYKSIDRTSSTSITLTNKSVNNIRTSNSTNLVNENLTITKAGTVVIDNIIGYFSVGESTIAESQNFRLAYNTYLTSIGLSPIA